MEKSLKRTRTVAYYLHNVTLQHLCRLNATAHGFYVYFRDQFVFSISFAFLSLGCVLPSLVNVKILRWLATSDILQSGKYLPSFGHNKKPKTGIFMRAAQSFQHGVISHLCRLSATVYKKLLHVLAKFVFFQKQEGCGCTAA